MREAMREVLRHQMRTHADIYLLGQDIEDPKGDVFGVTRGLSTEFPDRVRNAPLSESTILGSCIGQSLTGRRTVAFIQFSDFLPLAYNQLGNELGSIYWRTDGHYQAPVIVMVACGGYRPGMGPFHAGTHEALAAHVPGIDVFMPSTAGDAAGLLNAAFQSGRPTLFFYPKTLLNDPEQKTPSDVERQFTPIGTARKVRSGATSRSWPGATPCGSVSGSRKRSIRSVSAARSSISARSLRGTSGLSWLPRNIRLV